MPFSGYQDLNPTFADALQQMIAARPGISPFSGYRDYAHQARLFQDAITKYGSPEAARHWVAPPGKSQHNMRLAADLLYATPEDEAWAHANAANYGLRFRMGHEPRHIELINGKPTEVADTNSSSSGSSGSGAGYLPPRPERPPRYQDDDPFIPAPPKTDYSIGEVADIKTLANILSPRKQQSVELLKKIRNFNV